jgi:hypothetical protein
MSFPDQVGDCAVGSALVPAKRTCGLRRAQGFVTASVPSSVFTFSGPLSGCSGHSSRVSATGSTYGQDGAVHADIQLDAGCAGLGLDATVWYTPNAVDAGRAGATGRANTHEASMPGFVLEVVDECRVTQFASKSYRDLTTHTHRALLWE